MGRGVGKQWWGRIRAFLGPWPLQPAVTAGVFAALIFSYFIGVYTTEVMLPYSLVIPTVVAGLLIYTVLKLLRVVQDRVGVTWWTIAIATLSIWIILQAIRSFIGFGPGGADRVFVQFAPTFLRGMIASFLFITITGYVSQRLQREARQAKDALVLAREQQIQIIAADEDAKRQAALVLHDKVQAGLIASCLELQSFAQGLDDDEREALRPIIARLERMRSIDVGSAARVLSPNLVDVDLTTSLEELASQYAGVVDVVVDVDEQIDRAYGVLDENLLLGAYRVIEQALLNAVKHAKPTRVWISVMMRPNDLVAQVSDDGVGMPADVKPGIGTTIITTWVRALNGQWHTERGPVARGTTMIAVLPIAPQSHS